MRARGGRRLLARRPRDDGYAKRRNPRVVVLLVVVGALIVYLVPWRRRPAFASPSLSVELNPTTYNELGRSVEGI